MKISFERDSVSAGDDVMAPNTETFEFCDNALLSDVLSVEGPLLSYLPCVVSVRTHWKAWLGTTEIADVSFICEPMRELSVTLLVPDREIEVGSVFFAAAGQDRL